MTREGFFKSLEGLGFTKEVYPDGKTVSLHNNYYKGKCLEVVADAFVVRIIWWHIMLRKISKTYYFQREINECDNAEELLDEYVAEMARIYGIEA